MKQPSNARPARSRRIGAALRRLVAGTAVLGATLAGWAGYHDGDAGIAIQALWSLYSSSAR